MDPFAPSTIGVWPHPACRDDEALLRECVTTLGRTGGPGGQHRNKVSSAVFLVHEGTQIRVHADERRSAVENKRVALRRLRLALAVAVRCAVPDGAIGSALWRSRCPPGREGRISCNPEHHDYPCLLAEALDVLAAAHWDVRRAAARLECTASQLLKLIGHHHQAWEHMNRSREGLGLGRLEAR